MPDPHYSKRSNEQLAQQFLSNYTTFSKMTNPWDRTVTLQDVHKMASLSVSDNPHMADNIRLAKEMLRRPELMQALDRNGQTGALDNRFTRDDISSVINSGNPYKFTDDRQLIGEMLQNFNQLAGFGGLFPLSFSRLEQLASRGLTGHPNTDRITNLAREITSRSDVLNWLGNLGWPSKMISKRDLRNALE